MELHLYLWVMVLPILQMYYDQMQTQMEELGFTNAFIGTVEGKPEDTACEEVIKKAQDAGFKKLFFVR